VREPAELASKVFDAAAAGEQPTGGIVIKHGKAWLQRGPYATILMGVIVLDAFLRMPDGAREHIGWVAISMILFALGVVPLVWFLATRHDIAPRKGIALVLTPAEMLMRTRAGVHRVRWSQVDKLEITSRRMWSILRGQHEARALVIYRKNDDSITYIEAFLGAPAEVVQALCDGYRRQLLPFGWQERHNASDPTDHDPEQTPPTRSRSGAPAPPDPTAPATRPRAANLGGEVGRYGQSWLVVLVEGDERYRQFIEAPPAVPLGSYEIGL
jgi:hypothetical protein